MLTNEQKQAIKDLAKTYRSRVKLGEITARWAAEDCASRYTYPYAEAAHFSAVRDYAFRVIGLAHI